MKTYYVVFTDGNNKYLKWLKKDFRHVFVCVEIGDYLISLEDGTTGMFIEAWERDELLDLTKDNNWYVIKIQKEEESKKRYGIWFWAPTCVNFVKNIIGERCKAQTPYQLYKHLKRKGYKNG